MYKRQAILIGYLAFISGIVPEQKDVLPNAQAILLDAVKLGLRTPDEIKDAISIYGYNFTVCFDCSITAENVLAASYLLAEEDGWKEVKLYIWK